MRAVEAKAIADRHENYQLDYILHRIKNASYEGYHFVELDNRFINDQIRNSLSELGYCFKQRGQYFHISWSIPVVPNYFWVE